MYSRAVNTIGFVRSGSSSLSSSSSSPSSKLYDNLVGKKNPSTTPSTTTNNVALSTSSSSSSMILPSTYHQNIIGKWNQYSSSFQKYNNHQHHRRSLYTLAIARDVPNSFVNALSEHYQSSDDDSSDIDNNSIDITIAQEQHHTYVEQLRSIVPVLCLPTDETLPDCCFVEDTAVVINKTAVITRLGHVTRQKECTAMKQTLQQLGFGSTNSNNNLLLYDMNEIQSQQQQQQQDTDLQVTCDGGDVLYTTDSRYIFVGLSNRTTIGGANYLHDCFSNHHEVIVVPPILQGQQVLHLKSCIK